MLQFILPEEVRASDRMDEGAEHIRRKGPQESLLCSRDIHSGGGGGTKGQGGWGKAGRRIQDPNMRHPPGDGNQLDCVHRQLESSRFLSRKSQLLGCGFQKG